MTREELTLRLDYDPDTGIFTQRTLAPQVNNTKVGGVAGCLNPKGYRTIKVAGKGYRAHRLAWLWSTGSFPPSDMVIDHINGDRDDNRLCNLRLATHAENRLNSKPRKGVKGVHWAEDRKKWRVIVNIGGKNRYFGQYEDFELAELVAREVREKYHGEFVRHV